ncbi:MAG: TMEM175 family protein [Pyrinomonadaceae bacterium]
MNTTRLEAFSDAVIAILMTIMVLELKVPHGDNLGSVLPLLPIFLSYVLSFIYLGIYWSNHHHMLQATRSVDGAVLWANLHLLFWLSLVPFTTGWMGENHFGTLPTALYGVVLLCAAISYTILQTTIVRHHGDDNKLLADAVGNDLKGKISILCYIAAIALAFMSQWISCGLYIFVAIIWLIPDRRIERKIVESSG